VSKLANKLYFARHGQSILNVSGYFAGHTDTPLTEEGKRQARIAGQKARNLSIDTIVSSPLSRAYDTAKIITDEIGLKQSKIITSPLLVERFYGTAEETPYSTDRNHLENVHVGFETEEEMLVRVQQILKWLDKIAGENVLMVSHGGIGRRLRAHFLPDVDFFSRIPNAKIERWL